MGSTLPMEIILDEILTRASPETVARSRAVCKQVNESTQDWNFADKFHRRTKIFFLQYMHFGHLRRKNFSMTEPSSKLSLSFLPSRIVKIEAVAKQGLVLCQCETLIKWGRVHEPRFFVCKPATQQWREIPRPKTRYATEKFAMTVLSSNPNQLHYKIVRFSRPKPACLWRKSLTYCVYRCEIFDSATWAWRVLPEDVMVPFLETVSFEEPAVSVAGFFYALTSERRILSFDWTAESCHLADSLPAPMSEGGPRMTLFDCGGKLGVGFMAKPYTCMEVWVSEGNGNSRVWNVKNRVNIECVNEACGFHYASVLAMASNDVVVLRTCSGIKFFRLGSGGSLKNAVVKTVDYHEVGIDGFFCIESDEEVVDLKVSRRKAMEISSCDSEFN